MSWVVYVCFLWWRLTRGKKSNTPLPKSVLPPSSSLHHPEKVSFLFLNIWSLLASGRNKLFAHAWTWFERGEACWQPSISQAYGFGRSRPQQELADCPRGGGQRLWALPLAGWWGARGRGLISVGKWFLWRGWTRDGGRDPWTLDTLRDLGRSQDWAWFRGRRATNRCLPSPGGCRPGRELPSAWAWALCRVSPCRPLGGRGVGWVGRCSPKGRGRIFNNPPVFRLHTAHDKGGLKPELSENWKNRKCNMSPALCALEWRALQLHDYYFPCLLLSPSPGHLSSSFGSLPTCPAPQVCLAHHAFLSRAECLHVLGTQ